MFQSTHPHGVRRLRLHLQHGLPAVSIHAPTWGATLPGLLAKLYTMVSIHAPTWGATDLVLPECGRVDVSIHAPTWGATLFLHAPCPAVISFNPRTHVGCDVSNHMPQAVEFVSIHAPTWGATPLFNSSSM